jgi:hypothetical protein
MRGAWARFATDPERAPIKGWKVSGEGGGTVAIFGTDGGSGVQVEKDRTGKCEAWKEFIWRKHL